MIESILAIMSLLGFADGDTERPFVGSVQDTNQEIIRAIESPELKGFETLEVHSDREWFV